MDGAFKERILSHYPNASRLERWHMGGRLELCPYDLLPSHFTGKGTLLDIGCGFGHLAWYLREVRPDLAYFGTDIDPRKIALAQGSLQSIYEGSGGNTPAPVFRLGDVAALPDIAKDFGNIALLDVIYLMPWESQVRLLDWCLMHLATGPDSALVVKSLDEATGFSGFRAVAEEWIMVRLLRRTMSSGALNGMRPFGDYADFARAKGFRCEIVSLGTFNPSSLLIFRR